MKSKFLTALQVMSIRGSSNYRLTHDLVFMSSEYGLLTAPHGAITNFASIPRVLKVFIDNDGGHIRDAAALHDYLYGVNSQWVDTLTRKDCDLILIDAMESLGAGWLKRKIVYRSVRMFGMFAYKNT